MKRMGRFVWIQHLDKLDFLTALVLRLNNLIKGTVNPQILELVA